MALALVTGGNRGIGLEVARQLGRDGMRILLGSRDRLRGEAAAATLRGEGLDITPLELDVADHAAAEAVRPAIEAAGGRLDVLVNDIWGGEKLAQWNTPIWEHDLDRGLRMLRLAIDTHLITSHFALALLIRRPGGLVVEMTDGTQEYNAEHYRLSTFYDLAKTATIRLAFAQGEELAPHGCAAVALTPGWMRSEMMLEHYGVDEDSWRDAVGGNPHFTAISESPRLAGRAVAALAADPELQRRNGKSFSSGGLAREYGFTDVDGSQPDCWRYMVEVQDPGHPPDPTGYR